MGNRWQLEGVSAHGMGAVVFLTVNSAFLVRDKDSSSDLRLEVLELVVLFIFILDLEGSL